MTNKAIKFETQVRTLQEKGAEALTLEDYKAFFEALGRHVIASATDEKGNIIYVNDKFVEISKYDRAELMRQNHRLLKSGFHDPEFYTNLWSTISGGKVWRGEIRNRAKDGTFYWVDTSIAPILGSDGKPKKYVSVRFLITERKTVESELQKRKENSEFLASATALLASSLDYETVLRHVAELTVPRIADWCVIDLRESEEEEGHLHKVGVAHIDPSKRALTSRLQAAYPSPPEAATGVLHVFRTGINEFRPVITEEYLRETMYDEEHRHIMEELGLTSLMRVPVQHRGKVLGVITLVMGSSGRRYTEDDLELAEELGRRAGIAIENASLYRQLQEADKRKDEFIATLAHELRNPLAPLLLRAQILRVHMNEMSAPDPLVQETANVVERQVKTMARLLDDLLDISRFMRGKITLKKERVDVSSILTRAVEAARPHFEKNGIELTVVEPEHEMVIYADPVRIEQVVVNLLNNAAKFNTRGGSARIHAETAGNEAVIRVRDNGIGIDAGMLPKLFNIFIQEKPRGLTTEGGLGIGLALARNFITMHDGTITAESDGLGKGSVFTIRLPMVAVGSRTDEGLRILVVDDNVDAANALADYLKLRGCPNVHVAASGEDGIRVGAMTKPDFVLMDIRMPGMDGYEAVRAMRTNPAFRETMFIAITGYGQEEDRKKTEEAGFEHHFTKPVNIEELFGILGKSERFALR